MFHIKDLPTNSVRDPLEAIEHVDKLYNATHDSIKVAANFQEHYNISTDEFINTRKQENGFEIHVNTVFYYRISTTR